MQLEGLVTCVNYADFLAATLPLNRQQFDHLVVVTAPEDFETARLCEYWNVQCIPCAGFSAHWGKFNKARGINTGLKALKKNGWVVHFDADILLPPLMRPLLERLELDPAHLYGVDRHTIPNEHEFLSHIFEPKLQQENDVYVHMDSFPISPRISMSQHGGYVPIGFYQLWNPKGSGISTYPELPKTNSDRTDTMFATQWPRAKRGFLPEFAVYHLESEPAAQGANWNGRTTMPFGGKHHHHHHHWRRHHHHHGYEDRT